VAHAFCVLHEQGRVYRGTYMVNWAPQLQTAVSDLEVEYSEEPGTLFYFKYPLAGGGPDDFVPVSTTRPETILGDTAVAVHSEDPRFTHLVGRQLEVPFSGGRTIPLIADDYVDPEFGTGALKVTRRWLCCFEHVCVCSSCFFFQTDPLVALFSHRSHPGTTPTTTPSASGAACP
jgi:valyl-tRNA synthetase